MIYLLFLWLFNTMEHRNMYNIEIRDILEIHDPKSDERRWVRLSTFVLCVVYNCISDHLRTSERLACFWWINRAWDGGRRFWVSGKLSYFRIDSTILCKMNWDKIPSQEQLMDSFLLQVRTSLQNLQTGFYAGTVSGIIPIDWSTLTLDEKQGIE